MNTGLATRGGSASATHTRMDLVTLAQDIVAHRKEVKGRVESLIEDSIKRIRELRLAGMVNKTGADETCNSLILALQALEEIE